MRLGATHGTAISTRIDNFRYYDRVLSSQELDTLYHESFTPSCSDGVMNQDESNVDYGGICEKAPSTGLVAHYAFDGNTQDT